MGLADADGFGHAAIFAGGWERSHHAGGRLTPSRSSGWAEVRCQSDGAEERRKRGYREWLAEDCPTGEIGDVQWQVVVTLLVACASRHAMPALVNKKASFAFSHESSP